MEDKWEASMRQIAEAEREKERLIVDATNKGDKAIQAAEQAAVREGLDVAELRCVLALRAEKSEEARKKEAADEEDAYAGTLNDTVR